MTYSGVLHDAVGRVPRLATEGDDEDGAALAPLFVGAFAAFDEGETVAPQLLDDERVVAVHAPQTVSEVTGG